MKLNVADRIESSAERGTELSPPSPTRTRGNRLECLARWDGSWVAAGASVARHEANDDGPFRGMSFIEIGMGGAIKPGIARTTANERATERKGEGIL